jgi:hypothetical protein
VPESRYHQCRKRRADGDWPTVDPFARRTPSIRQASDVMRLLGRRRVTIIGASTALQMMEAVQ